MDNAKLAKTRIYKTKVKIYPDGSTVLTVYKNSIVDRTADKAEKDCFVFADPVDEFNFDNPFNSKNSTFDFESKTQEEKEREKEYENLRNLWKIRTKIKDYILSNDFNYFWTITFSPEKADRYDYEKAFKIMSNWLRRMKRKYGKFDYIIIPELHKDGAIHFHGVTGGLNAPIVDSGVKHKGSKVYNCFEWEHGFTTLTKIRNKEKTASYVTKYVTKKMQNSIVGKGKKKYWLSQGLRKPDITFTDLNLAPDLKPDYENDICAIYKL